MEYKENSKERADDTDSDTELSLDLVFQEETEFESEAAINDSDFEQLTKYEHMSKKAKMQSANRFSLKARRAIEDHLERRRLRKELDYLFDDEFSEENTNHNP